MSYITIIASSRNETVTGCIAKIGTTGIVTSVERPKTSLLDMAVGITEDTPDSVRARSSRFDTSSIIQHLVFHEETKDALQDSKFTFEYLQG